jgi:hypothetical protein
MADIYELILHGVTARNIEQARAYLNGDAHAQTKVELYDGNAMLAMVDAPAGNYPVCARNGEQASLLVTISESGARRFGLH